jgi:hypothetical protein
MIPNFTGFGVVEGFKRPPVGHSHVLKMTMTIASCCYEEFTEGI